MNDAYSLRPATVDDEPLLLELYKSSRAEELAQVPWTPEQLSAFLKSQYDLRKQAYDAQFRGSRPFIVVVDGTDAGQIWIDKTDSDHKIVDIVLFPAYRKRGIGTILMKAVLSDAEKAGVPVISFVATNNPGSLQFHTRLGFVVVKTDDMYYELEYKPHGAAG